MNKVYRLIWSSSHNAWVVTSEITKSRGKRSCKALLKLMPLGALLPVFALAQPPPVDALPTGGQVVAGQASMAQSGNTLNINQGSQRAAIDWQGFNIGSQATVNFQQPSSSSVALNRVVGGDASQIMGNLNANGQVFITNPNGVIFGRTASVNVGGLVATTHSITNEDFMAGDDRFTRDGATGSVINEGQLSADLNGYIALLAPEVRNEGVIVANMGTVALAAGEAYTLQLDGNRLTGIQVEPATLKALVDNKHAVQAPGGLIILSARAVDSLQGGVVKNSGVLQASSLTERGGVIRLEGDHIALDAGSELIATGATGGGQVLVGGDWQGSGDMHQATTVTMEQGAKIDVSATQKGDGGKAVLWSDLRKAESVTTAKGSVLAKGGAQGGNGGKVETSASTVDIDGFKVDTLASEGEAGLWLIDPYDYNINAGEATTIANALNSSSVTISTSTNVSAYGSNGEVNGNGDININSNMIKHGGAATTLTLSAARNIRQRTGVTIGSDNGLLNMDLQADSDKNGDGIIFIEGSGIGTRGGNLTFGVANQYATINGASVRVGGDVFFQSGSLQTVYTGGGALNVYGEMIVSNTSGLTINSEGGNVNFNGLLNSGNAYTFISKTSGGSWDEARAEAKGGTAGGSGLNESYLVNITSRLENSIAGLTAGYKGAWIGAYRADSTKFDWSYANGPEAGQVFFTQNSTGGGSVKPGYYANFGSGEPNGKANTDRAGTETVGQFFGSAGSWNDLTHATNYSNSTDNQYAVTGFVRETNLAGSPIIITAGSGVVSFNGGVGASKALASLNVTAGSTVVNGNALITTGAQNYSSSLTVNAGNNNFNLGGTGITTGGAASFSGGSITTVGNGLALNTGANNVAITANAVTGNKITLNTTGALTYAPLGTNWTNVGDALNFDGSTTSGNFTGAGDVGWLNINSIAYLRGLTLGKVNNISGISIDTAVGIAGPIALYGSDISINAGLTTTGSNTITLKGTGNVTDGESGYVSASNLLLLGGNVALDNASNSIGTLAASGVGSLTYVDNNALTIGSVGSTSGINATGTVSISTLTGDLTASQNINTSDTTANALVLNAGRNTAAGTATGGNLILTGSPSVTVGNGGTAKLYSGSVSGSTGLVGTGALTSSSGRFRYGSDETTTNYTKALSTGLNVIYRERPSATVVVDGKSMTYGDSLVSLSGSVTGALNGDVASYVLNNRVNSTSGNIKAGFYTLSETGLAALGYTTTVTTNTLSVGQKTLTLNNFAVNASKVYDGSKTATISNAGNLSGLVGSDVVTAANGGATYDNKNVGTDKTVTLNGVSITSTDAANYTIASTATTKANITAAPLTVTATTVSKTYDGNTSVTEKGQVGALAGAGAGEVVNSSGTQAFIDKNVGTNKIVKATGVTIKDSDNADVTANYAITYIANAISAINRLNSVTWIGGATGNWFDPANWAGGAVPDLSNVANVVIPTGVTVTFDTTGASGLADVSGPVNIETLGGDTGNLVQTNGQLKVGTGGIELNSLGQTGGTLTNAGTTVVDSFSQSGGSFSGTGNMTAKQFNQTAGVTGLTGGLTVTQNFSQGDTGNVTVGGSTQITDTSGGVQLGNLTSTGALTVNSTGGAITQATGTALIASVAGTFSANNSGDAANIILANVSNNFGGLLTASGANITLKDIDALVLGAVVSTGDLTANSNGNLTMGTSTVGGNLSADTGTANGNISQTGVLSVTGSSTLNSGTGNTSLTNTANDFLGSVSVTGQDINLVDANSMSVALTAARNSTLAAGGDLAVSGNTQNLTTTTTGAGITSFGETTVAGNLAATSAGAVSQTSALAVTGTADFMAAGQNVTLSNAGNNFAGVVSATANNLSLADLNGITLGAVTTTGTLGVAAVGDIAQAASTTIAATGETTLVSTVGRIVLANATNDFATVNASGTQVSLVDTNGISVALTTAGNSSLAAGGDLAVSGTTQNLSTTTTGAGITSFGTTTVAGDLVTTSAGKVSQSGALVVNGTTEFSVTGQDVTLNNTNNNFVGVVSATANNLSLADLNGIMFGAVTTTGTLGVAAVGDITQTESTRIAATGETTLASTGGSIVLGNATNDFATVNASGTQVRLVDTNGMSVALTTAGNSSLAAGGNLAVSGTTQNLSTTTTGTGATSFGATTVAGNLAANSAGAVSQTGVLAVTGTAGFMAAGQDVTLNNTANNFKAVVNVSGANVTLNDMDDLVLGSVTATGKLDATAGAIDLIDAVNADTLALKATTAAVSQTGGTLVVTGQSDLQAATNITLDQANNFNGAVNASGANVTLNDTDALVLAGVIARGNLIVTTGAGNLAGGVTQTGAIVVDGTTQFIANTKIDQEAVLTQANDFKGAVSFTGLNDGSWKNLTINDSNTLTLGDVMAGGLLNATATAIDLNGTVDADTLALKATNGAISQTGGALVVTGQSDLRATTDITLNQANDFNDLVNASGANITLNDTDDLVLGSVTTSGNLTVSSNADLNLGTSTVGGALTANSGSGGGNIIQTGPLSVVGESTLNAGAGNINLSNPTNSLGGVFNASANNVTVADNDGALTLGTVNAAGKLDATAGAIDLIGAVNAGSLALKATNGAISQTGGALVVTGQSDLRATTDITLNQANDFNDLVNASGANITLNDTDDLVLGSVTTSGNLTVSSNGDLNLGTSTVGGALTANSGSGGGNIIQTGPLSVVGDSTLNAGAGNIDLSNTANSLGGVFNASANNMTVADNDGALTLGAVNAAGKLDATAGAIDLIGAVNAGSLDLKATIGAISQTGGTLTVAGQSDLQAATDITLNQANDFVGRVNAQGRNVSLADINDLNLGGITTTGNLQTNNYGALNLGTSSVAGNLLVNSNGGNITASGPLMVAGSTGLYAGSGVIELDNPKNSFGGSVIAQGALVVLASSDSLPSTPPAPVIPAVALPFAAAPLVQTTQSMPQALSDTNVSAVQMFVLQEPSVEQSGVITVLVPREVILLKSSFRFTLPTTIYDVQRKVVDANVTLLDGQPLPAWLRFNAKTGVFSADAIPENAMPLQVRLTVDGQDTVVEISLQEE